MSYTPIIDGLDASQKMIDQAKAKGIYRNFEAMYLGTGEPLPQKYVGKYDHLTCTGSLVPGHIPSVGFDQMRDAVKDGGYIMFSVRDRYYEPLGHKAYVDKLVADSKLKYVKAYHWIRNEDLKDEHGIFYPEPATVYVY